MDGGGTPAAAESRILDRLRPVLYLITLRYLLFPLSSSMSMWDEDFINAEVPGYFEFGANTIGSFQFGYVQGELDYRSRSRMAAGRKMDATIGVLPRANNVNHLDYY